MSGGKGLSDEDRLLRFCNCDFCYWGEHYTKVSVDALLAQRTAALTAERDALREQVARVEALHYTVVVEGHQPWCHQDGGPVPCRTIRALHPTDGAA